MSEKNYGIEILFKALADRTRLKLINLIGDDEVCVCFFVAVLKTNQPKDLTAFGVSEKVGSSLGQARRKVDALPNSRTSGSACSLYISRGACLARK